MSYQLSGTIKEILEPQTFASGFSKREFVVTSDDKFPQDIKFECLKEKAAILDNAKVGDRVTVQFDINGREYNGRYFVNLNAWRLDGEGKAANPAASTSEFPEDTTDYSAQDDEIPF